MFHALESIFDHSWEIGYSSTRNRGASLRNNLHREPFALSRLNMDAFYLYGSIYIPRKGGWIPWRSREKARDTGVATGEYIPDEDETGWQTANRMSWPLRFALSRLCIRSTLASPGVAAALATSMPWFLEIFVPARLIDFLCPLLPDFSTISLYYLRNFIMGGRILEEKFSVARNIFRRETLKSYWNVNIWF